MTNNKPLFIYLDQNKWIDLARAYHNQSSGNQFISVLQKVIEAVKNKKAVFPLSGYHLAETQKNSNYSRRQRLAKVMATISQGWTMSLSEAISIAETQIAGANIFGYRPPQLPPIFGHGINFALGTDSRSLIAKTIDDPIARSDNFLNLFEAFTSTPEVIELLLSGTGSSKLELREAKNEYEEGLTLFAKSVEGFRAQLGPHSQSESEQKKLYINNLKIVSRERINNTLNSFNYTLDDIILSGEKKLIAFLEEIPSLDVEIQLSSLRNANWGKMVDKNDLADISVLTIAIPYCDIVVTEKSWRDLAMRSGLDKKYNTIILSDVKKLENYL